MYQMRVLDFSLFSPKMLQQPFPHLPLPPSNPTPKPNSSHFPTRPLNLLQTLKPHLPKTLTPIISSSSLIHNSCIAITAAALFLASLTHRALPARASPLAPRVVDSAAVEQTLYDEENERSLERYVASNPDDVKALQSLMECKVRSQKLEEAIAILERLSCLQPDETEWILLRANLHSVSGEAELARKSFEEVLKKEPLCVEAYHGIVMALSQSDDSFSAEELRAMFKRVEVAMEACVKDGGRNGDVRDFKLLLGQIKVFEGNFGDALKMYKELEVEEPRDHMPYLCQGIVLKLLSRDKEAGVQFEKYKKLAPKDHPYTQYLENYMFGSLAASQKVEGGDN